VLGNQRLGDGERVSEPVVEALGQVTRHLEMLLLVVTNGHEIRPVQQDVGRHQDGIAV